MIPKFRAWDTYHEKWVKHFYITENGLIYDMTKMHGDIVGAIPIEKSGIILMQSTGLFDKNGKEIFEGDIVTDEGSFGFEYWDYGTVFYDAIDACWCVSWLDNEITNLSPGYIVYGNIHENPVIK